MSTASVSFQDIKDILRQIAEDSAKNEKKLAEIKERLAEELAENKKKLDEELAASRKESEEASRRAEEASRKSREEWEREKRESAERWEREKKESAERWELEKRELAESVAESKRETERAMKRLAEEQAESKKQWEREKKELDESVAASKKESEEAIRKSREEAEKKLKEIAEEEAERKKDLDKSWKEMTLNIGGLGGRLGQLVEFIMWGGLVGKLNSLGYSFEAGSSSQNVFFENEDLNLKGEIDILLIDSTTHMLVESKSYLRYDDVDAHVLRLEKYSRCRDAAGGVYRVVGTVAGALVTDKVRDYAFSRGLPVATLREDDRVELLPTPEGFVAACW